MMSVDELFGPPLMWIEVITRSGFSQGLATCRLCACAVLDESDNLLAHLQYHEQRGETL